MRKIIFFAVVFSLLLFSCSEVQKELKIIGTPEIISFYPDSEQKKEVRSYVVEDSSSYFVEIFHKNGELSIKGLITDNQRQGEWKAWNRNANLLTIGNYKNDKDHGFKIVYYPNGNVRYQGEFIEGDRVGKWKFYTENGDLAKEIEY